MTDFVFRRRTLEVWFWIFVEIIMFYGVQMNRFGLILL